MEKLDQQQLTLNKIQGPHIFVKVLSQNIEQAGAELCQAQGKLKLVWLGLDPCFL